jgi:hypothetical protein
MHNQSKVTLPAWSHFTEAQGHEPVMIGIGTCCHTFDALDALDALVQVQLDGERRLFLGCVWTHAVTQLMHLMAKED